MESVVSNENQLRTPTTLAALWSAGGPQGQSNRGKEELPLVLFTHSLDLSRSRTRKGGGDPALM